MASCSNSLFRKSIRGWFYLEETRALGALKPTVSGIGFYLHKELGAAEVGILSTQRISCGRDPDFIYTKNIYFMIFIYTQNIFYLEIFYLHKQYIFWGVHTIYFENLKHIFFVRRRFWWKSFFIPRKMAKHRNFGMGAILMKIIILSCRLDGILFHLENAPGCAPIS